MSGLVTSASTVYSGHLRSSSWDLNWSKHFGPNAQSESTTKICKTHLFWFLWVPIVWINDQLQKHSAFQNHKSAAQKDQPQRGPAVGLVPANRSPGTSQDKALWLFETVSINRQWFYVEYTIRTDQMQMPISPSTSDDAILRAHWLLSAWLLNVLLFELCFARINLLPASLRESHVTLVTFIATVQSEKSWWLWPFLSISVRFR